MIELCASSLIYAGYSLETALGEIARAGYRAVDLWAAPRMCVHVDPLQDDAARVRRLLDEHGLRPAALSLYGSDVTRALAGIDFAAALGAKVVVTGAGVRSLAEGIEYLKPLTRRAEARKVVVAAENHVDSPLELLAEMSGLLQALDGRREGPLGIAYAPPHSFACGEEPENVILGLGKRISFFYSWDVPTGYRRGSRARFWSDPYGQLPGSGSLDFDRIFAALRDVGYSGFASVVWHGALDWELHRITSTLRAAADFLHRVA
jgi:sugar phosphate isomerase/epimerase